MVKKLKFVIEGWEGIDKIWLNIFDSKEYVLSLLSGLVVAFIGIFFQFMYFLCKRPIDKIGMIIYALAFLILFFSILWISYQYSKISKDSNKLASSLKKKIKNN